MKRSLMRTAATLTAAGAIIGATLAPSLAAPPTPTSLGLPTPDDGWVNEPTPLVDCLLGDSCIGSLWYGDDGTSRLLTSSGYVGGDSVAKAQLVAARAIVPDLEPHAVSRQTFTHKYTHKKRQHRQVLHTNSYALPDKHGIIHIQLTTVRDLVRKKKGTKGPFAKKVGLGMILLYMPQPIPAALNAKKAKKLSIQMRGLTKTGSTYRITGTPKIPFDK